MWASFLPVGKTCQHGVGWALHLGRNPNVPVAGALSMENGSPDLAPEDGATEPAMSRPIPVRLLPHAGLEPKYATDITINFTGNEFLVSVIQTLPPVYRSPDELPKEIEATVLFRGIFAPKKWAEAVDSLADQVASLRSRGVLPARNEDRDEDDDDEE